jgi:hypothetical protein
VSRADLAARPTRRSSGVATPLHRHAFRASTPPCRHCCRPGSVPRLPASESRSARVVLHHLGGFLRSEGRGLVASRCQSWGSPRFVLAHSPRRFSHPPKDSTRPQPHHVTVAVAPLPFPPAALAFSDRFRCQNRPSKVCPTGAPASRLCSAAESVTPSGRCQPGAPYPSWASFPFKVLPEVREPPRSLSLCLRRSRNPKKTRSHRRSVPHPLGLRLAGHTGRLLAEGDPMGMAASTRARGHVPSTTWHQTSKMFRRTSPTGKHRHGRSRMMPRIEALRRPKADQGRGSMRTESLRRFTESRERVPCSPGPDRSQDPGRRRWAMPTAEPVPF